MASEKDFQKNVFHGNISKKISAFLSGKQYSAHFILVDDNTANFCLPILIKKADELFDPTVIEIFSGESFKNIDSVQQVWERLTENNADRNAVLINLGGGMVCDLGGFAAATYKRGIDFIHIPTTLLSQADAAYGGKQGIDFFNYKNQVGVFKDPDAIFIDQEFLQTLPDEQITNGFAEVVKHGLLAGGKFWKRILGIEKPAETDWKKIVKNSAEIKLSVVENDPKEKGLRKILNFGHTIGHAIETDQMNAGKPVLHGFCVAAGMIGELYLSHHVCGLSKKKMDEAVDFIRLHFPPVAIDESPGELLRLMRQDKKNESGRIQFALLEKIGIPVIGVEIGDQVITDALKFIQS